MSVAKVALCTVIFGLAMVGMGAAKVWAQPRQDCPGTDHPCHMHWQPSANWYRMHCDQLGKELDRRLRMTPEQLKQAGPMSIDDGERWSSCLEVGGGNWVPDSPVASPSPPASSGQT